MAVSLCVRHGGVAVFISVFPNLGDNDLERNWGREGERKRPIKRKGTVRGGGLRENETEIMGSDTFLLFNVILRNVCP